MSARASAVSLIINRDCGRQTRRRVGLLQTEDGTTTVYTHNGARHQAAALSRARRALIARGYEVETFYGDGVLPLAQWLFYLRVYGKVQA